MSRIGMIGQISLASANLSNDGLKEGIELLNLFGGDNGPAWIAHLKKVRKMGLPDQPKPERQPLFSELAQTSILALLERPTVRCFTGSRFAYRDSDFDTWLPSVQPAIDACVILTLAPKRDWLFAEGARALPGVEQSSDIAALGRSLIENGYTMTLAQAEEIVEVTERGVPTQMRVDGYGNFFFVETGDEKNPVSVGRVRRFGRGWLAGVHRLDYDCRWHSDNRLLVRNLDSSNL